MRKELGVEQLDFWADEIGVINRAEWSEFFTLQQVISDLENKISDLRTELISEAETNNEQLSTSLIEQFYSLAQSDELAAAAVSSETVTELGQALAIDDIERAYEEVGRQVSVWRLRGVPEGWESFVDEWQHLPNQHAVGYRRAEEVFGRIYNDLLSGQIEVLERWQRITVKMSEHQTKIALAINLDHQLQALENERADLPVVKWHDYQKINEDVYALPFASKEVSSALPTLVTQLHRPAMRQLIEEDLAIDLNALPFNSQLQLLSFMAEGGEEAFNNVRAIMRSDASYKNEFLTAFLACAGDYSFGERIIKLTKQYDSDTVQRILRKYGEIVQTVNHTADYLAANIPDQLVSEPEVEADIVRGLLRKGKQTLELAAMSSQDETVVLDELNRIDANAHLMASTFKELVKRGETVDVTRLPGVEIEQTAGGSLSESDRHQILEIVEANWRPRSHMYEKIMQGIQEKLEDPNTIWHLFKQNDRVIGCFRLDHQTDGELYFGSVNIMPSMQKHALINVLLQQMLQQEIAGKKVLAHCDPWDQVTQRYLETGFFVTKMVNYSGQPAFEIKYDEQTGSNLQLANLSYEELLNQLTNVVQYTFSKDPVRSPGEAENERFMRDVNRRVTNGAEVISNYQFSSPDGRGYRSVLVAFEPVPSSAQTAPDASWPNMDLQ